MGSLGAIEGMTLADNPNLSPASGPFPDPQALLDQSLQPNASTSSLQSFSSYQSGLESFGPQQASFTDGNAVQTTEQFSGPQAMDGVAHGSTLQNQRQQQPSQPIIPQLAVSDAYPGTNLTFEQILQHISSEGSQPGHAPGANQSPFPPSSQQHEHERNVHPMPWTHHQNASAPDIVAPPWQPGTTDANKTPFGANDFPGTQPSQSATQTAFTGGLSPRPIPTFAPVRQPTREDSFDKLKKYLKLDVNMAYSGPQDDSPTTSGMRKRSASDAGPGLLGLTTSENADGGAFGSGKVIAEPANFSEMMNAKQGLSSAEHVDGSTVAMPMFASANGPAGHQWGQAPPHQGQGFAGGQVANGSSNVGPMRSAAYSSLAREAGAGTPYSAVRPSHAQRGSSVASTSSSGADSQHLAPGGTAGGWAFPGRPASAVRNVSPHGQRRMANLPAGHRRAAQSEDLSGRSYNRDASDFLRTITAPDGSLAPPGAAAYAGPVGSPHFGATPGSNGTAVRPQQTYQTSYDRLNERGDGSGMSPTAFQRSPQQPYLPPATYASLQAGSPTEGSNSPSPRPSAHSPAYSSGGATAGSPAFSPPNRSGGSPPSRGHSPSGYSQTALPTYTTIAPRRSNGGASSPSGLSPSLITPAVQNVTTSATQAASASRRKNDAQFVCPVPGCGSHFTRQFNLRSHLRSHADERPFKCPAQGCTKAFARAHDAKRHYDTLHLSVKKYVCEHCGRQFARLDALHRHLKPDSGLCAEKAADQAAARGETYTGMGGSSSSVQDSTAASSSSSKDSFTSANDDAKLDVHASAGSEQDHPRRGDGAATATSTASGFTGHVL